ncbi:ABC-three component system middle component 6 [Pararhodobacter zhoushanensis]|uniref:ABC-three component system middle component 6 n=1 Tax=Pararhodobacter zhoushanensis TaxID=2479545 RepID=UPI000F8CCFB3|nr:ABC-three component system middle component 6 [Pararhodobacter zhoushanensis]
MILPGKHLKPDRALLSVGGEILTVMGETSTVSVLWDEVRVLRSKREDKSPLPFDWFLLALTLLYTISAIDMRGELLIKKVN